MDNDEQLRNIQLMDSPNQPSLPPFENYESNTKNDMDLTEHTVSSEKEHSITSKRSSPCDNNFPPSKRRRSADANSFKISKFQQEFFDFVKQETRRKSTL